MEKERTNKLVTKANGVESSDVSQSVNANNSPRTASKEQFDKAQRKTKALHAGLFRRLAK